MATVFLQLKVVCAGEHFVLAVAVAVAVVVVVVVVAAAAAAAAVVVVALAAVAAANNCSFQDSEKKSVQVSMVLQKVPNRQQ